MVNQLKLSLAFAFVLITTTFVLGQNSLPTDNNVFTQYTAEQKIEIKQLLTSTKSNLEAKLQNAKNDEYINRVLMTNSYKFAKGYSTIMDSNSVPFKLITSSTSFLGCWANNNFEGTGACWDKHLYKANVAEFASLN